MNYNHIIKNIKNAFLILAVLITMKLHGQTGDSSFLIGEVIVEGTSVSADVVKLSSGLSEGKTIFGEDIQAAIKKLWKLNLFSDIVIDGQKTGEGGIILIIKLEDLPRLNNVKISGFDKYDKDDIEPLISLRKGQIIKKSTLSEVEKSVEDFYRSKNYLKAEAVSEMVYLNENEVDIELKITEGKKIFVEKINFSGNEYFDKDDLLDQFESTHEDRWWRDGEYDREKFEEDLSLMAEYAHNEGYKDFYVVKDSVYYDEELENIFIDITVKEGRKYYFGETSFEGNIL
ncbi:MAG: POTRA domain-containing protein, partial [Candidatus Delongbacteria bacterium]